MNRHFSFLKFKKTNLYLNIESVVSHKTSWSHSHESRFKRRTQKSLQFLSLMFNSVVPNESPAAGGRPQSIHVGSSCCKRPYGQHRCRQSGACACRRDSLWRCSSSGAKALSFVRTVVDKGSLLLYADLAQTGDRPPRILPVAPMCHAIRSAMVPDTAPALICA